MLERINLVKYGCVRNETKDFSDDGSRFRVYDYKGLEITYLKDNGRVYISNDLTSLLAKKIPSKIRYSRFLVDSTKTYKNVWFKLINADTLNGVSTSTLNESDLQVYFENMDYYIDMINNIDSETFTKQCISEIKIINVDGDYFYSHYETEYSWKGTNIVHKMSILSNDCNRVQNLCEELGITLNEGENK